MLSRHSECNSRCPCQQLVFQHSCETTAFPTRPQSGLPVHCAPLIMYYSLLQLNWQKEANWFFSEGRIWLSGLQLLVCSMLFLLHTDNQRQKRESISPPPSTPKTAESGRALGKNGENKKVMQQQIRKTISWESSDAAQRETGKGIRHHPDPMRTNLSRNSLVLERLPNPFLEEDESSGGTDLF